MYELNRVLLVSVGPPKARYDNVLLDFTARPDDPASLPSVIWLQNGGGKGVLLKLGFSVLLPHRRDTLGAESDTRTLNNMVLANDTAHIALEWRRVDGARGVPPLLVTGKVWEWQGLRASGDSNRLQARFYSFHPIDGVLTLTTLPIAEPDPTSGEPRKIRLAGVMDRLGKFGREHPQLNLAVEQRQKPWHEHLTRIGLDPELFRYQVQMNRAEGKADEIFKFDTDKAFVDFFLRAILDRDEAQQLADFVSEYAGKLASRSELMLQGAFVSGALERLRPLAAAHEQAVSTRERLARAYAGSSDAADAFVRAAQSLEGEAERQRERAREQADRRQRLDRDYDRLNDQRAELGQRVAQFRLAAAQDALTRAERHRTAARKTVLAWQAVEPLLRYRDAVSRRDELALQMQVAQTEAEPFRVARDEAATRLAATLSAAANQARELARAKTTEAANQIAAADEADEQALRDTRTLEGVRRDISDIERRIHAVRTTQEKLHAEGFVHADEPPAAALTRHEAQRQRLNADHEAAEGQLDGVEKRHGEVADELAAVGEALATLKPALEAATAEHARLSGQAQRLATHDVVSDILDTARGDLWTADVQLLEGLRERINRIERALIDTRLAAVEDERTVEGVTSDGLVPGHPDVLDTVQVLQQLGISAHPGWQYLHAHLPEERRAAAIAACPELAAGIVITVPSHLERAREAIASSGRTVRTLVTVGDARTLLAELYDDGARDDSVIVPPLPGLYDDAAAAEDAERAQQSLLRAGELRAAHELELAGLRSLTGELNDFWEACPPGKLDGLRAEINALEAQDATARQRRERLTGERDQLIQRRTALTTELKRLRNAMSDADRVIPRLRAWSEAAQEAAESQRSLGELVARVTSLTADISGHRGRAAQARADADRLGGQAKTDADRGDKLVEELGQLLGVAEDFDATLAIDDVGAARVRHEVCQRRYSEQTTDSELAVALDNAETATAKALGALADFDADIQARAAELIAEHCGADRGLRRTAERQARDDADAAETAHGNAQSAYDRTARDAEAARPAEDRRVHAQLPPELEPQDLNAALALHARAIRDAETKLAEANSARQGASEATALAEATARDAQTLNDIAESVSQVLQTARSAFGLEALPSAELHFSGSIDLARQRRSELNRELATASEAAMRAAGDVTAHVNHVWHYARSPRFAALREGRMVARLADDSGEQIATHAAQRVTELSQRAAQIELILDEISQHRDVLIGTLTGQVKAGLRALKAASRASRMPDALGEWSGREFVRVDFTLPDSEDTLHDRLGAVLDEAADGRTDRNGVDLVLRGVHAAARPAGGGDGRTGGFRVTVLKPDTVLENVRVPVSDMSVFSGGQRLTAAIALYCTMARMRATERGRPRNGNSGVLFLDNPLGTANAEYLLHIQLGVAQALGVQLVYTTGINDLNALSKFGRVLPLRNDADLRQGLRFVHLAPELLDTLRGGRDLDDDRGYLSSSVLVAPTAAASGVGTVDVSALLEAQVAGSEGTASANGATGRASDES